MVILGSVPGVKIGQAFAGRRELHDANVHRGLMRGIAPQGSSVVLSGGVIDDKDYGDLIIYTGEGGNDPNTKRQVADQTLTGGNLALAKNWVEGIPVRVVRGHKLDSDFAPEEGYRYDGLYRIDDHWEERGQDGFLICRYRLEKLEEQPGLQDQGPSGVVTATATPQGNPSPGRTEVTTSRVIRCTQIGNEVKGLYGHACQVCGTRLETPVGPYAECCHIRPLGRPHNGPDTMKNVLCLCANCHVLFDKHAILISEDLTVVSTGEPIAVANGHEIYRHELEYHRSLANG